MGTGDSNIIQMMTDTKKSEGDRIRYTLRQLLTGAGALGDDTLVNNEEPLATYTCDVVVDQLRHAVRSGGRMSEQRVPFSVREEARMGLEDWWKERIETSLANQLTGNTTQVTDVRYTGLNAATAPSTGAGVKRIIVGGGHDAEGSLSATTTHAIKLSDLDTAAAIAKTQTPRIRPVNVDGKRLWVCFLHPYQIRQLRLDASTAGNFFDVQKAMLQGGKISDNPIVTGAEFIYNSTVVHEWPYLPNVATSVTSSTSYRRGVFCGAQAAAFAVGQGDAPDKMTWVEEYFDYENELGVAAGMIFGAKKSVFNSNDFSTIVLSGYAPAP